MTTSVCKPTELDDVERVAAKILDYVRAHIDAADSVDGIQDWWLEQHAWQEQPSYRTVEQAVERLVHCGLMERSRAADGIVIYSGNFDPAWRLRLVG